MDYQNEVGIIQDGMNENLKMLEEVMDRFKKLSPDLYKFKSNKAMPEKIVRYLEDQINNMSGAIYDIEFAMDSMQSFKTGRFPIAFGIDTSVVPGEIFNLEDDEDEDDDSESWKLGSD